MTNFAMASQRLPTLSAGAHQPDGHACALEYLSVARGIPWTDQPETVRCWDIRPINDIPVSDALRTTHLLPLLRAYDGSMDWPIARQISVVEKIIIATVNHIIAELQYLPEDLRAPCRVAATVAQAGAAARAATDAADAAARGAADAADAAARAARATADAASAARATADAASAAARAATLAAAGAAAGAAAARAAARAARAAADAAARAADAASAAARAGATDNLFIQVCAIWLNSARGE